MLKPGPSGSKVYLITYFEPSITVFLQITLSGVASFIAFKMLKCYGDPVCKV